MFSHAHHSMFAFMGYVLYLTKLQSTLPGWEAAVIFMNFLKISGAQHHTTYVILQVPSQSMRRRWAVGTRCTEGSAHATLCEEEADMLGEAAQSWLYVLVFRNGLAKQSFPWWSQELFIVRKVLCACCWDELCQSIKCKHSCARLPTAVPCIAAEPKHRYKHQLSG